MDVRDIIRKGLQAVNATGLCNGECGCEFPDLVPCESDPCACVPAVRRKCATECVVCGGDGGCMVPVETANATLTLRGGPEKPNA